MSLIVLRDEIKEFIDNHKQVRRFEFEFEEQLPNYSQSGLEYPLLFCVPVDFVNRDSLVEYTMRFYCYNRLERDRNTTLDNMNDTMLILIDLMKWFSDDNSDSDILIINNPIASALNNSQNDYLQGYVVEIVFEMPSYSRCDIPLQQFYFSPGYINTGYIF